MARHYERSETRRRQIAEAALRVISDHGLSGFTTKAIAAEVGITDGTLFRHFRDKEEIVLASIEILKARMFDQTPSLPADPVEALEVLFRSRARFIGAERAIGRLVFSDELARVGGPEGQASLQELRLRTLEQLAGLIGAARVQGRLLETRLDDLQLAQLVMGQLLTFGVGRSLDHRLGRAELEAMIERAWETLAVLLFRAV